MGLLKSLIELVLSFFMKKEIPMSIVIAGPKVEETSQSDSQIDWTNPACKVSKFFMVHEMLYLPTWKRLANESDGLNDEIKNNLIVLAQKMDIVREYFNKPVNVHVTYRPLEYNKAIGGALNSAHSEGKASDFDIMGMTCDEVRYALINNDLLKEWSMRCEKNPGSNWVHLDYRDLKPGGNRYFIP